MCWLWVGYGSYVPPPRLSESTGSWPLDTGLRSEQAWRGPTPWSPLAARWATACRAAVSREAAGRQTVVQVGRQRTRRQCAGRQWDGWQRVHRPWMEGIGPAGSWPTGNSPSGSGRAGSGAGKKTAADKKAVGWQAVRQTAAGRKAAVQQLAADKKEVVRQAVGWTAAAAWILHRLGFRS